MNSRATTSITAIRVILAVIGEVLRRNHLHSTSSFMAKNHDALIGSNRSLASAGDAVVETESGSLLMKRILAEDAVHIKFTDTSMQEVQRNLKRKVRQKIC